MRKISNNARTASDEEPHDHRTAVQRWVGQVAPVVHVTWKALTWSTELDSQSSPCLPSVSLYEAIINGFQFGNTWWSGRNSYKSFQTEAEVSKNRGKTEHWGSQLKHRTPSQIWLSDKQLFFNFFFFSISMSRALFGIYLYQKKVFFTYLRFKFNLMSCIFIW